MSPRRSSVARPWRLIAQTSAAKIYWALATLGTATITARYLGPAGRGVYVAAFSWVSAFATMGYLSLSQVVVFMATGKSSDEWLPRVVGSLLTILAAIAVLGWAIAGALYAWRGSAFFRNLSLPVLLAAFAALPFLLWIENGNGVLMALGKLNVLNLAQVLGATASLALTFLFVGMLHRGVTGGLVALVFAQAIVVSISLGYIVRHVSVVRFDGRAAHELLTGGVKVHLNAIGTYLFTQANVLILNYFKSPQDTAYYQLAVQLVTAMQLIPLAVSTVVYSLVARDGPDASWPQHRKLLGEVLLLVFVLCIVAYFFSPFAIRLIFGAAFSPTIPLFRILLLSVLGMTVSIVMSSQWIARGLFLQAAALTLFAGAVTVLANFLVVPRWGATGAAWVTVGTYGISMIGNGMMAVWVESRWRRSAVPHPDRTKTSVLLVIAHLGQGGAERFAFEVLKSLDKNRFDVAVLTKRRPWRGDYYDDKIQALGIPVHRDLPIFLHYARRLAPRIWRIPPVRWSIETLHKISAGFTIGGLLDRFDVIEIVQIEYYYLIQPLLKDNSKLLIHLMSAGFQYRHERPYADCRPGRKYRFTIFDPSFRDDYIDANCKDADVLEFPLAIDLSHTSDLSACARFEPPYKIGMFIRITPERPVDGILRAFAIVAKSVDAQLIWYGHGDPAQFLPLLNELGIRGRVTFPGQALSIERELREAGLAFVYTTGTGSKMGYAGVEVASYGFPMLVWDQADTPKGQTLAETNGAIHAHYDPRGLAAESLDLLQRPEEFRALGRELREYIISTHDMQRNIGRLEAKLEEIAAETRRGSFGREM
jgi:O-antigen/teichoic acid export membrane protein/glycosyltransferase involved in cell wall biosynthesis